MHITKKTKKFIVSRAFYLALGIFFASAIVVCATWDQARTTNNADPNQLTEDNWNAFVNMLESKL